MSDIITARDPEIIAAEINTIKREIREAAIYASIRIGEKLVEAKSMVEHGQWGKWLEEHVEYSQSTANYLMQLYQEYGTGQRNLFDSWTNSQTFGRLSYSQHIALLTIPFEERQSFAEENKVEDMTARQLQQAIRERDEAVRAKEFAQREAEAAKANAEKAVEGAENRRLQTEEMLERLRSQVREADETRQELDRQLETAREDAEKAREKLRRQMEKPEIPDDVMANLRKEAEEEAARKAAADAEKKVAAAEKAVAEATRRAQELQEDAEKAREGAAVVLKQLEQAQKQARMGSPDVAVFQTLYVQLQETWNRCMGAWKKVGQQDEDSGERCRKALEAAMEKFRSDMAAVEGG